MFWYITKGVSLSIASGLFLLAALFGLDAAYALSSAAHGLTLSSFAAPAIDPAYPQASWALTVEKYFATNSPASWLLRIPVWAGIAGVIGCAVSGRSRIEAAAPG